MVRGLGRALGKVIGRAPGREDNRDSDEVSQRRRPTTSPRRQRKVVTFVKDAPHMVDVAKEVFQQPEEAAVDA